MSEAWRCWQCGKERDLKNWPTACECRCLVIYAGQIIEWEGKPLGAEKMQIAPEGTVRDSIVIDRPFPDEVQR